MKWPWPQIPRSFSVPTMHFNQNSKYISAQKTIRKNMFLLRKQSEKTGDSFIQMHRQQQSQRKMSGRLQMASALWRWGRSVESASATACLTSHSSPTCSSSPIHFLPPFIQAAPSLPFTFFPIHPNSPVYFNMPDSSNPKERKGDSFFWLTIELYEWLHPSKNTIVKSSPNAKNAVDQILRGSSVKNLKVLRIYPWNIELEVGKRN